MSIKGRPDKLINYTHIKYKTLYNKQTLYTFGSKWGMSTAFGFANIKSSKVQCEGHSGHFYICWVVCMSPQSQRLDVE